MFGKERPTEEIEDSEDSDDDGIIGTAGFGTA
jgi:hypothetical protein